GLSLRQHDRHVRILDRPEDHRAALRLARAERPPGAAVPAGGRGMSGMSGISVDVMIPTFNEADHIRQTVENARKLGPVFVLDSLSTDGTQQMARDAGATVIEHPFVNYSAQKNLGPDNIPFSGEWIFILDADERITPALRKEIQRTLASDTKIDGYYVNSLLIFMGRAVRHGG